jgi:hypothetical protein
MRYLPRPTTSSAISGSPSIINARPCRLYYVEARQSCGLQLVNRILKKHGRPEASAADRLRAYPE